MNAIIEIIDILAQHTPALDGIADLIAQHTPAINGIKEVVTKQAVHVIVFGIRSPEPLIAIFAIVLLVVFLAGVISTYCVMEFMQKTRQRKQQKAKRSV